MPVLQERSPGSSLRPPVQPKERSETKPVSEPRQRLVHEAPNLDFITRRFAFRQEWLLAKQLQLDQVGIALSKSQYYSALGYSRAI